MIYGFQSWEVAGRTWGLAEPHDFLFMPFEERLDPVCPKACTLPRLEIGWLFYQEFGVFEIDGNYHFCEGGYADSYDVGRIWVGDPFSPDPRALESHIYYHGPPPVKTEWEAWNNEGEVYEQEC